MSLSSGQDKLFGTWVCVFNTSDSKKRGNAATLSHFQTSDTAGIISGGYMALAVTRSCNNNLKQGHTMSFPYEILISSVEVEK